MLNLGNLDRKIIEQMIFFYKNLVFWGKVVLCKKGLLRVLKTPKIGLYTFESVKTPKKITQFLGNLEYLLKFNNK